MRLHPAADVALRGPQLLLDFLPVVAQTAEQDHVGVVQILGGDACVAGQWMSCRYGAEHGAGKQWHYIESGILGRQPHEAEISDPAGDRSLDVVVRAGDEFEADGIGVGQKIAHDGGQDGRGHGVGEAHLDERAPEPSGAEFVGTALQAGQYFGKLIDLLQQYPGLGGRDQPPPITVEQVEAQIGLECGELPADRGLRELQDHRGANGGAGRHDSAKDVELLGCHGDLPVRDEGRNLMNIASVDARNT